MTVIIIFGFKSNSYSLFSKSNIKERKVNSGLAKAHTPEPTLGSLACILSLRRKAIKKTEFSRNPSSLKKDVFYYHLSLRFVKVVGFWGTWFFGLYLCNRPLCICESIFCFFISHIWVFLRLRTFHRPCHTLDSTLRAFSTLKQTFTYNSFFKEFENAKL